MTPGSTLSTAEGGVVSLYQRIRELEDSLSLVRLAISYYDYETTVAWSYRGDVWFHAASTMKVAVMAAIFHEMPKRGFSIEDPLHVRNRFASIVDGSPYQLDTNDSSDRVVPFIGKSLTIRELIHHMITTSSNLATNLLVQLIGVKAIEETLDDLGVNGIRVLRGVEDTKAWEAGLNNEATANGLNSLIRAILDRTHFSEEASEQMLDILHEQKYKSGIPAGLPKDARVAHKTGNISTVHHDTGVVFFEDREPYVLSVLTEFEKGRKPKNAVAEITGTVHASLGELTE